MLFYPKNRLQSQELLRRKEPTLSFGLQIMQKTDCHAIDEEIFQSNKPKLEQYKQLLALFQFRLAKSSKGITANLNVLSLPLLFTATLLMNHH